MPQTLLTNGLAVSGGISGFQATALISALSQKRSFDLLSEPTALTKSGEQATLEAIRVFPYPVAFDPPELLTQTASTTSITTVTYSPPAVIATTRPISSGATSRAPRDQARRSPPTTRPSISPSSLR